MKRTHLVLKQSDIDIYCSSSGKRGLRRAIEEVGMGRVSDNKRIDNRYLVINLDEPYANEVIDVLKKHGCWED